MKIKLFRLYFLVLLHTFQISAIKIYSFNPNLAVPENCDPISNGEYLLLDHLIGQENVVFDIGANVGDYTKQILSLNRSSKIYSFEPIKGVFEVFKNKIGASCEQHSNLSNLFYFKNSEVRVFNIGFYKKNIDMPIWYAYSHDGLSSIYDRSHLEQLGVQYKQERAKFKTLDDFCLWHNISKIDFLKIDTEGAEYDVLQGAEKMLISKRINCIQFEYGGTYLDAGYTLKTVFDYLTNLKYVIYKILPNGLMKIDIWQDSLEDYKFSNFIAVNKQF
jgi:FkbM family methyltransferase